MSDSDGVFCRVCGKRTKFCKSCETMNSWRRLACCEQHRDMMNLLSDYRDGFLTKSQVRDSFLSMGIHNGDGLLEDYAKSVNRIFEPDPQPKPKDEYHPVAAKNSVKRKHK